MPGTVAGALRGQGAWHWGEGRRFDDDDWWYRCRIDVQPEASGEEVVLALAGLATVAEVWLDERQLLRSESMYLEHEVPLGPHLGPGDHQLAIVFRALTPRLRERRPRPRWRSRIVAEQGLRWWRTTFLGRSPGFAPEPAPVGPFRPVTLERRRVIAVEGLRLATAMEDDDGLVTIECSLRALGGRPVRGARAFVEGPTGVATGPLELQLDGAHTWRANAVVRVPAVAPWWPHTHGHPVRYAVRLEVDVGPDHDAIHVEAGQVGFRQLAVNESGQLRVEVNGKAIFCRGALWTPPDIVTLGEDSARAFLIRARDAGFNMLRIAGTTIYPTNVFYDACDELGILVWQDFMFANLDYPVDDEAFCVLVEQEASALTARLAGRPSLAVVCGGSEVAQQVAMLGLDPDLARGDLVDSILPEAVNTAGLDAAYLPSSPIGEGLPFRPDARVSHYFGVGAYLRPLSDARTAGVGFASECLAFANVPDDAIIDTILPESPSALMVHHPAWKARVPRDAGAGWDFDDVRDHYLELLYGVAARPLRSVDHGRYLDLSRATTGEVMAEVIGEWRRPASPCNGALVLALADFVPGAGWGILDSNGKPKAAYWFLRRSALPIAVWTTDEGLGGIGVHVANDRAEPFAARLRIALYRADDQLVGEGSADLTLPPHGAASFDAEGVIGRFVDVAHAYRFGPAAQTLLVASLEREERAPPLAQAFRFPLGRPASTEPVAALGMRAIVRPGQDGGATLRIDSEHLAYAVAVEAEGFEPSDDYFSIEPGGCREIGLTARQPRASLRAVTLAPLNANGRMRAVIEHPA